jgi:ribosomal-protein-alanine N-acetyltransferase
MNLPPYPQFPSLKTENLLLREVSSGDTRDIIDISFYDGKPAKTEEEAMEINERINRDYRNGESIHWGITDLKTGKLVGTCGYYRGFADGKGELGCILKTEFRGRGLMTATIAALIDFGLHEIGLKKITAITTETNLKAIAVLERLQFIRTLELENGALEFELRRSPLPVDTLHMGV